LVTKIVPYLGLLAVVTSAVEDPDPDPPEVVADPDEFDGLELHAARTSDVRTKAATLPRTVLQRRVRPKCLKDGSPG
jgi:hypothetical protein